MARQMEESIQTNQMNQTKIFAFKNGLYILCIRSFLRQTPNQNVSNDDGLKDAFYDFDSENLYICSEDSGQRISYTRIEANQFIDIEQILSIKPCCALCDQSFNIDIMCQTMEQWGNYFPSIFVILFKGYDDITAEVIQTFIGLLGKSLYQIGEIENSQWHLHIKHDKIGNGKPIIWRIMELIFGKQYIFHTSSSRELDINERYKYFINTPWNRNNMSLYLLSTLISGDPVIHGQKYGDCLEYGFNGITESNNFFQHGNIVNTSIYRKSIFVQLNDSYISDEMLQREIIDMLVKMNRTYLDLVKSGKMNQKFMESDACPSYFKEMKNSTTIQLGINNIAEEFQELNIGYHTSTHKYDQIVNEDTIISTEI